MKMYKKSHATFPVLSYTALLDHYLPSVSERLSPVHTVMFFLAGIPCRACKLNMTVSSANMFFPLTSVPFLGAANNNPRSPIIFIVTTKDTWNDKMPNEH